MALVETGDEAPDFELPDQDGQAVRLSDLRGTPVVLYFYPRADTPGCWAFPDPVAAVKKFHYKQGLTFRLLADEDHSVAGAQRATFVIDAGGTVADVIPKVSPKTHDEQVLKILGSM